MTVLTALQGELASATDRLLATAATLSDADVTGPSLLPGWTRGHVLAHVAKNADSHLNLLTWAKTGIRTPQYASLPARSAEIEATAAQPAARHLAGLADSAARLATAIRDHPVAAWSASVQGMHPPPHPAWYILVRRLREIGLHHVDLDTGYGPADWPPSFVLRELHDIRTCWPHPHCTVSEIVLKHPPDTALPRPRDEAPPWHTPGSTTAGHTPGEDLTRWRDLGIGPAVEGAPADMLAWLTGRSGGKGVSLVPAGQSFMSVPGGTGLPEPPPWLTMPAPADLPATPPEDYP
ncbi:maleylpyruvate isomerase family mycothiol-dependent enzyme [Nonomuraea sp. NPDC002799]